MIAVVRGNLVAFGMFATAFALHIVGGATDQGWLFTFAVVVIFWTAIDFPTLAVGFSGAAGNAGRLRVLIPGALIGVALTSGALWAAADRTWQLWTIPVAIALVAGTYLVATLLPAKLGFRLPGRSAVGLGG
ncbi:MAG: hypothetical protein ACKVVT_19185 [Dehalococcoidia bacterium]